MENAETSKKRHTVFLYAVRDLYLVFYYPKKYNAEAYKAGKINAFINLVFSPADALCNTS